jgi:hypothetical protein
MTFDRDHLGAPKIAHPTRLVKSGPRTGLPFMDTYGRPSSLGKQIENSYNLTKWGERMALLGLGIDASIRQRAERLAEAPPEARDEQAWKDEADALIVDAKNAAKAWAAAEQGTHGHEITEDDDDDRDWIERAQAGEILGVPVEAQRAMIEAWRAMLADTGLEVLGVEVPVVHDDWRQAGTLDRIVRLTRDLTFGTVTLPAGLVVVLDLKTGKLRTTARGDRIYYWQSYAVQIACYARANAIYEADTHTRRPIPWPVNPDVALIAHLPVADAIEGKARCELILVDVAAGAEAAELCVRAKQWDSGAEAAKSVFARGPVFEVEATVAPVVSTSLISPASPDTSRGEAASAPMSGGLIAAALASTASAPCPTEGAAPVDSPTGDEVEDIADAEGIPTWAAVPDDPFEGITTADIAPTNVHPITPTIDPEGGLADQGEQHRFATRFGKLSAAAADWIKQLAAEAHEARVSFSVSVLPSRRRLALGNALVALAEQRNDDNTILDPLLRLVGVDPDPSLSMGAHLGALTIDQATRLAVLAEALGTEALNLAFTTDGEIQLIGPALVAV